MGLPDTLLCEAQDIELTAIAELSITLPGAAELSAFLSPGNLPNKTDVCNALMGQVNAALTPLVPIFRLLDVALCIFQCVEAVPDSIGPPPDPVALIKAIAECALKIDFLLELIPQLSVCVFVKGIIELVLCALESLRETLANLVQLNVDIAASEARMDVLADAGLDVSFALDGLACAKANAALEADAAASGNAALNRLIGLLNIFLQLIGVDPIPALDNLDLSAGAGIDLAILDTPIEALELVLEVLPC